MEPNHEPDIYARPYGSFYELARQIVAMPTDEIEALLPPAGIFNDHPELRGKL